MSDNLNTHTYNLYVPKYTECFLVEVPANPSLPVRTLAVAIDNDPFLRKVLSPDEPYKLFKYCKKYDILPAAKFDKAVVDWLSTEGRDQQMAYASLLGRHFPHGPMAEGQIDVIIATDSVLRALEPAALTNQTLAGVQVTRRTPEEETRGLVTEFLNQHVAKLHEYLRGPAQHKFWEAPPSVEDDQTRHFINKLKIPMVNSKPVLLLHGLGEDIVDPSHVNRLFPTRSKDKINKFLVNTSGSGKTRLLLEGLTNHWGFYFTFTTASDLNKGNHMLGSGDLQKAMQSIPSSMCFKLNPWQLPTSSSGDLNDIFSFNDDVAKRSVYQILTARVLVFERFLETARKIEPTGSLNGFKQHWLFLQLLSGNIFPVDLFAEITMLLKDASNEFLLHGGWELERRLVNLQDKFGLDHEFFLVLDEAQVAAEFLPDSFRSRRDKELKRPVLRPILEAFVESTSLPIIVSGNGLSIDVVNDVANSSVGKGEEFCLETRTGAFDSMESQRKYILRYMPEHIVQTASGKALVERAWSFTRGRHRFTAALLTQLLVFNFQSPHKILNGVVNAYCGFRPSDAELFVEDEQNVEEIDAIHNDIEPFNFSKILKDRVLSREISKALYHWIMLRRGVTSNTLVKELVELGFARFREGNRHEAYIDEPLVLLAAARAFENTEVDSLVYYVQGQLQPLGNSAGTGKAYEAYIGYYLACAFDGDTRLCDTFEFGKSPPKFSKERAELVSVVFTDHGLESNRFNLLRREGATASLGVALDTRESTMEWLKKPTSLMCFPFELMGPDIVLFIRVAGVILAVLLQCKWASQRKLKTMTLAEAKDSVNVRNLFQRGTQTRANKMAAKECAFELFRRLNGGAFDVGNNPEMEWDGWLQDGMPVLRVIASYPASCPQSLASSYHTVLKMDSVEALIDERGLLRRIRQATADKRGCGENEEADYPSKKPRV